MSDDCGFSDQFAVEAFRRQRLLHGLDEIGMTLTYETERWGANSREGSRV